MRRLIRSNDDGLKPAWSPNGREIAFADAGNLLLVKADGSRLRPLTRSDGWSSVPVWSPVGKEIAFIDNAAIKAIRPDGTGKRVLLAGFDAACRSGGLAWSPDGARIAFSGCTGLYVMNRAGGDLRRIAGGATTSLSWSPGGRRLVYQGTGMRSGATVSTVYRVDAGGGSPTEGWHVVSSLLPLVLLGGPLRAGTSAPAINGLIAFERGFADAGAQLWVMNQDGSKQRRLAEGGDPACSASPPHECGKRRLRRARPRQRRRTGTGRATASSAAAARIPSSPTGSTASHATATERRRSRTYPAWGYQT